MARLVSSLEAPVPKAPKMESSGDGGKGSSLDSDPIGTIIEHNKELDGPLGDPPGPPGGPPGPPKKPCGVDALAIVVEDTFDAEKLYEELYCKAAVVYLKKVVSECPDGVGSMIMCIKTAAPVPNKLGQMNTLAAIFNPDSVAVNWEGGSEGLFDFQGGSGNSVASNPVAGESVGAPVPDDAVISTVGHRLFFKIQLGYVDEQKTVKHAPSARSAGLSKCLAIAILEISTYKWKDVQVLIPDTEEGIWKRVFVTSPLTFSKKEYSKMFSFKANKALHYDFQVAIPEELKSDVGDVVFKLLGTGSAAAVAESRLCMFSKDDHKQLLVLQYLSTQGMVD